MTAVLYPMISKNFALAEAVVTTHREIANTIPHSGEISANITKTAAHMEDVRALLGKPITVLSWYRCLTLNTAIGGTKNSDHLIGCAVDFICPSYGDPLKICQAILRQADLIGFKQLILEHTWVHISFSPIPNTQPKLEVLSLLSGGGYANGLTNKFGVPYK